MGRTIGADPSIVPLAPEHRRAEFESGVEALDRYIRTQAGQDLRKHSAAVFVLVEGNSTEILGYYTLSATSVELSDLPEATARKLPKYPTLPAILLGRLAVDLGFRGRGFGELLLLDALRRCLRVTDIAWTSVIVDAKDESALAFYERYRFIPFSNRTRRLFLPYGTIASLFR